MQYIDKAISAMGVGEGNDMPPLWKKPVLDVLTIEDTEFSVAGDDDGSSMS